MQQSLALNHTLPITPQVYHYLRRRIVTNDLPPGSRISESEIGRACLVSRQPVREAFIKLVEQGLVAVLPQRGTLVSKIAYVSVLDARFLREAIEADIVRIVASNRSPGLVASLRTQLTEQRRSARHSAEAFTQHDEKFHLMLAEAAGMPGAWKLIEGLKSQMDRVRFLSLAHFPMARLIAQHKAVVDQIAAGSVSGAEAAVRLHLRQVLTDLPGIVTANPDYFDLPAGGIPQPVYTPSREA